jgi:2-phosphosulfolactate phosphatase
MQVEVVDFVAGARAARGIAVIIDVFRAFSLAAHAFGRGAASVIPIGSVEHARELKRAHPDWLLIGERHARPLPGFDCGNSPTQLEQFDLHGRTLIHTTHAGTQGLVNAEHADEVLTGALVNAGAIVRYVLSRNPEQVTLVRMGHEAMERCDEDDACAAILAARLAGQMVDERSLIADLRHASSARKFFDPACDWAPAGDFDRCTALDKFDFVLRLSSDLNPPCLTRIDIPRDASR